MLLGLVATARAGDGAAPDAWPVDAVITKVATKADPSQQYSLYLPPHYSTQRRWPVLVMLDARGHGEAALRLAVDGARANGWIVVSSYQSRSDTNEIVTLQAIQALLREALQGLASDPRRIYLAGLSGTAKTLWTRAEQLNPLLAGMIGCGGGRPPELGALRKPPAAFLGMAGTEDFNYEEMRDLDAELADAGATHRLLVFPGVHGWPPAETFTEAIGWLELVAMRDARTMRREDWIDARFAADHARAISETGLERWRRLDQMARDYRGLRDVGSIQAEADTLRRQPGVRRQVAGERRLRSDELEATHRLDAWIARVGGRGPEAHIAVTGALAELRVASLREMANGSDRNLAQSARRRIERILAFTGFYLPGQFAKQGETARAVAMLRLALDIEPAQPYAHWRIAQLEARAGHKDKAFAALEAARALGYVDVDDLQRNPAWATLRSDARWATAAVALPK
jgi:dienelactone hydrolase